jgi:hypothetical protein
MRMPPERCRLGRTAETEPVLWHRMSRVRCAFQPDSEAVTRALVPLFDPFRSDEYL